jgi:hypothetical protein
VVYPTSYPMGTSRHSVKLATPPACDVDFMTTWIIPKFPHTPSWHTECRFDFCCYYSLSYTLGILCYPSLFLTT